MLKEVLTVSCDGENQASSLFQEIDPMSGNVIYDHQGESSLRNAFGINALTKHVYSASNRRSILQLSCLGPTNSENKGYRSIVCPEKIDLIALSTSSENQLMATASGSAIQLWEIRSGWKSREICEKSHDISKLIFAGNDRLLISGSKDGKVNVWDVSEILNSFEEVFPSLSSSHHKSAITDLYACNPSASFLVWSCSEDHSCQLYNVFDGEIKVKLALEASPQCLVCSAAILTVYVGLNNGDISVFTRENKRCFDDDTASKSCFLTGHKSTVTCLSISQFGSMLASGGIDKRVCLWDTFSRTCLKVINQSGPVLNIMFVSYVSNGEFSVPPIFMNDCKTIGCYLVELPILPKAQHYKKIRLWDMVDTETDSDYNESARLRDEIHRLKKVNVELMKNKLCNVRCEKA
ncbi:hypothetical protein GJ496_006332 [Pomphorhynchus laevis]|nr:hypothetical protein GJ496_006332 [Pomphorhynchus laevis]